MQLVLRRSRIFDVMVAGFVEKRETNAFSRKSFRDRENRWGDLCFGGTAKRTNGILEYGKG